MILEEYHRFCDSVNEINALYCEAIESKQTLFKWASKEIRKVFKKHMLVEPSKVHFANDGSSIDVIFNLSDFSDQKLPLTSDLVKDLFMPVQVKILDNYRLVFVLLPEVESI